MMSSLLVSSRATSPGIGYVQSREHISTPKLVKEKPRRQRTSRPKARTGCLTCKRRRVKCDERKPRCLRCETFGVTCDGYAPDEKTPPAHTTVAVRREYLAPKPYPPYLIPRRNPHRPLFTSGQQHRYFNVFCEQTVSSLSGFFDEPLWGGLVLQACEADPSIRHAIIAIGALDTTLNTTAQSGPDRPLTQNELALSRDVHYKYAVHQYATALKIMRDSIARGQQDLRATLVSCLLAVCFELFHGNMKFALAQAQSGLKLIEQWLQERKSPVKLVAGLESPVPSVVDDELIQAFARLDIHAISFKSSKGVQLNTLVKKDILEICRDMPPVFSTFVQARAYWELLLRQTLHWTVVAYFWGSELRDHADQIEGAAVSSTDEGQAFVSTSSPEERQTILEQQGRYLESLERWMMAFTPILKKARASSDPKALAGATTLYLRWRAGYLALHGSMFKDESQFDDHAEAFADILSWTKKLLTIISDDRPSRKVHFSFDSGVVGPLYVVACLCRDRVMRRQAIAMLEAHPRREGVWDSVVAAKAATIIMNIEEEGLEGDYIPNHSRIRGIKLNSDLQKRMGELQYFKPRRGNPEVFLVRHQEFSW